jgi:hypothetical protein
MMNQQLSTFSLSASRLSAFGLCAIAIAVSACSTLPDAGNAAGTPPAQRQYVSVINSLNWTDALSGKPDGLRSSWPLESLRGHQETFPLAQIKQCNADGEGCAWGVMSAQRIITKFSYVPGGISLDMALKINIGRSAQLRQPGLDTAITMPSDVPALRWSGGGERNFMLVFGKVQRIEFDYGIGFDVCALRYDANGRALDVCDIRYF